MSYQRDFSNRVPVVFVGSESHAYRNLLPAMNYLPVELKAICVKSNLQRAERTAAQYGCQAFDNLERMLDNVDATAVIVCLPPIVQAQIASAVLDRGKHLWIEKPPGVSSDEVQQLLVRQNTNTALVGFKKVFMPVAQKAREILNSGVHGKLSTMLGVYPIGLSSNAYPQDSQTGVSKWISSGVHPVSMLLSIGGKAKSVRVVRGESGHGVCCITFVSGVIGNLHLASGASPIEEYRLYGDDWHLEMRNNLSIALHRTMPRDYETTTSFISDGEESGSLVWEMKNSQARLENKALFTQGIYGSLQEFFDCVLTGRKPELGSLEFALEVMKVCEGAMLSDGNEIYLS